MIISRKVEKHSLNASKHDQDCIMLATTQSTPNWKRGIEKEDPLLWTLSGSDRRSANIWHAFNCLWPELCSEWVTERTWETKQVISISRFAWRGHSSSYQTLLGEGGEKKTPQVKDYSSTLCKTVNWISNGSLLRLNDWRKSSYNLRGINILTLPKVNGTTYEQRSWRYKAAQLWNTLPLNLRAVTSYKYFETIISQIDLSRMYVFNLWACL